MSAKKIPLFILGLWLLFTVLVAYIRRGDFLSMETAAVPTPPNSNAISTTPEPSRNPVKFLCWTSDCQLYQGLNEGLGTIKGNFSAYRSPEECWVTADREQIATADAILFRINSVNLTDLPPRKPGQPWIVFHWEPPTFFSDYWLNPNITSLFDLKYTYSRLSDIWSGVYERGRNLDLLRSPYIPVEQRDKDLAPVAWIASNCRTANRREEYVKELMQHIPVNSYGSCVHTADLGNPANGRIEAKLVTERMRHHKFYLSFENAECWDYVTEKYWNAFHWGLIPVVIGAPNIRDFYPAPKSVINARDFLSPKELAEFLNSLAKNDTAYSEYLEWKKPENLPKLSKSFLNLWTQPHGLCSGSDAIRRWQAKSVSGIQQPKVSNSRECLRYFKETSGL
jgi:hypothetical protein